MSKSTEEVAAEREGKGNKDATKKAFYRLQREKAEESGDQKTTDKIYSKMGKQSHDVDSSRLDKAILGGVATGAAIPEAGAMKGASMLGKAMRGRAPKILEDAEEGISRGVKGLQNLLPKSGKLAKAASGVTKTVKKKAPASATRSAVSKGKAEFDAKGARKQAPRSTNDDTKQFSADGSRSKKALNIRTQKEEYVHPSKTPKSTPTSRGKAEFTKDGARKPRKK